MSHQADRAESALRELGTLTLRTRLASRSMATGYPLVGWGLAWIVGLAALDLLAGVAQIVVAALAWSTGMLLSWWPMRAVIRTGAETRMRWAWAVVLVSSPFLLAAADPRSAVHAVLLLGALWGLAMCLYAVATGDRVYAAVAGLGIVAAGLVGIADIREPLLCFGLAAGVPMLALGIHRVRAGSRRV